MARKINGDGAKAGILTGKARKDVADAQKGRGRGTKEFEKMREEVIATHLHGYRGSN